MSRYDDPDSPDYVEFSAGGDGRTTPEEREIARLEKEVNRLRALASTNDAKYQGAVGACAHFAADAARWRWWVSRTGAVNNELKFPTPDVNRHLVGVDLMRGSVAEHYSKAVDAAMRPIDRTAKTP